MVEASINRSTYRIIGHSMRVHREIGPGIDEDFYHRELAALLEADGFDIRVKPRLHLKHRGIIADTFECDILVAHPLVLELKMLSGPFAKAHWAQVFCYLKAWSASIGLLMDFGKARLEYRRIAYEPVSTPLLDCQRASENAPSWIQNRTLLLAILRSVDRVLQAHGLGYRDTSYRGLLKADLTAEALSCQSNPVAPVLCAGKRLGECRCECLVVEGEAALLPLALRQSIGPNDRARLQTYLHHLGLPWGVIANYGKRTIDLRFVRAPSDSARTGIQNTQPS